MHERVYEQYWILHVLWENGAVGDDYAEQRLDELTDLLTRKAGASANYYYAAPMPEEEQEGEPEEEQAPRASRP